MSERSPPIAWTPAVFFVLTNLAAVTLVPWWWFTQGFSGAAWLFFGLFLVLSGLGVTVGYHRLWAHRTLKARGIAYIIATWMTWTAIRIRSSAVSGTPTWAGCCATGPPASPTIRA